MYRRPRDKTVTTLAPHIETPVENPVERGIARKSAVWHLIQKGHLFQAYYDTETTDLDKRFSEITQFGGVITDLAGNVFHTADYRGKVSPYTVISPFAWVIQRMRGAEWKRGDPQYLLAGRIMQFFRYASDLSEAPYAKNFLKMCREGVYAEPNGKRETYYSYPLMNDDGSIDWDCVRIHHGLRKFYYLDNERGEWIKRDLMAQAVGYNNVNADDQWIWTMMHMACASNIFVTHLPIKGMRRFDALRAVEAAYAAGPKGENGVKIGIKNGRPSFSQGDVLEANTRFSKQIRDVTEGIILPDGSHPDIEQLHGAFRDCFSLVGLMQFLRHQVPGILREMERNSDWKDVAEKMTEKAGGFGNHPVMSYVDKSFPYVTGMMISLIGTDQRRNNPKLAVVYNLGIDPETFRFNNKALKDLTPDEHATLILEGKKNQNGVYKIIRLHHCPRVLPAAMGFEAGFNNGLDLSVLHERAKYMQKPAIVDAVMAGLKISHPYFSGPDQLELPQPQEELFSFSTLEMYSAETGENVQVHLITNPIEKRAQESRTHETRIKALWFEALEPDKDILLNVLFGQDEKDAVQKFMKQIESINKRLRAEKGPPLPPPARPVENKKTAFLYMIQLLFRARNLFAEGQLKDLGHHFWFEDQYGHKIYDEDIKKWPQWRVDETFANLSLTICHEELHYSIQIIDQIIESLGWAHILGPQGKECLNARKALMQNGLPNNDGRDRWYTLGRAARDTQRIENNELQDEDIRAIDKRNPGAWQKVISRHPDLQASFFEYKRDYLERLERFELTAEAKTIVGLNPKTGSPILCVDYSISPQSIQYITIPERYLEKPPRDPHSGKKLWVVPLADQFNNVASQDNYQIVLRAHGTGKYLHLPKAVNMTVPAREGSYQEFYKAARARFDESNVPWPGEDDFSIFLGEGPHHLHNARPQEALQTIHVPKRHFESLIDHDLAGYRRPVSGMIIRDDHLTITPGEIRLLEKDTEPTGWEITARVTKARRMTLDEIEAEIEDPSRYGFQTKSRAIDDIATVFANRRLGARDPNNKVWVIDFDSINPFDSKKGIFYFNPAARKISVVEEINIV